MRKILPFILASITNHPREIVVPGVDFNWNSKLWVHNVFRVYEMLFGRRAGIKAEMSAWADDGVTYYKCHSWESIFALAEANIRGAFKWKLPSMVRLPQLTPVGMPAFSSPFVFAIASDTQASGVFPGVANINTISSYVLSGSNTLLMSHAWGATATTAVVWGVNTLTAIASQNSSDGSFESQYVLVGLTGTNNLSVTSTSNTSMSIGTSYTGVNQSTTPDSFVPFPTLSANTKTYTTTVVASNCWMFLTNLADDHSAVASTGAFLRQQGNNVVLAAFDTNGTVGTGSQSMTVVVSASTSSFAGIISSFKPSGGAATTVLPFKSLLGVGI